MCFFYAGAEGTEKETSQEEYAERKQEEVKNLEPTWRGQAEMNLH